MGRQGSRRNQQSCFCNRRRPISEKLSLSCYAVKLGSLQSNIEYFKAWYHNAEQTKITRGLPDREAPFSFSLPPLNQGFAVLNFNQ